MSMTKKEAILLSAYTGFLLVPDFSEVHKFCEDTLDRPIWTHEFADSCVQKEIQEKLRPQIMELIQNISALRPVTREQVEKVWRGEWEMVADEGFVDTMGRQVFHLHCPVCDFFWRETGHKKYFRFCPACGAPMTDEAVDMVMERLEALKDGN